jgi:hypothetical protein
MADEPRPMRAPVSRGSGSRLHRRDHAGRLAVGHPEVRMSRFASFREFYPYYLGEHRNPVCRRLHFAGSTLVLLAVLLALLARDWRWLLLAPVAGYGFAWVGHFLFERNRPATFRHPLYSLMGDWVLYWQVLTGEQKL